MRKVNCTCFKYLTMSDTLCQLLIHTCWYGWCRRVPCPASQGVVFVYSALGGCTGRRGM
ncbi:hypothetical protein B0O99DRAFT_636266 [Bisporella sp. PMI_857]|nr:hypothetical protein B0O99DRAFT_636266 [Bisporella sp. PMI_857]